MHHLDQLEQKLLAGLARCSVRRNAHCLKMVGAHHASRGRIHAFGEGNAYCGSCARVLIDVDPF